MDQAAQPEPPVELPGHRLMLFKKRLDGCGDPTNAGNWRARIGHLPPHQHDQVEAKKEESQAGDSVLDSNYLVIGRENIFSPKAELMVFVAMLMRVIFVVRINRGRSVHFFEKVTCPLSREKA